MCLAIPGKLTERFEAAGLAMGRVDFDGVSKEVCLAFLPQAAPGDYVLVHVGFAISKIEPAEAERVFRLLEELGEVDDALS
jgi:hydrogenase expression/formation protein HypC